MKMRYLFRTLAICIAISGVASASPEDVYFGGFKLSLGMSESAAMETISAFHVSKSGDTSFIVSQYDKEKEIYNLLGVVGITDGKVSYLSRKIDTKGWPGDEGFSIAMAIYYAISGVIQTTDPDGTKRSIAEIAISDADISNPFRGRLRTIDLWINGNQISIGTTEGPNGNSVDVSSSIRSKKE